jgi:hypothetical protein
MHLDRDEISISGVVKLSRDSRYYYGSDSDILNEQDEDSDLGTIINNSPSIPRQRWHGYIGIELFVDR